PAQVERFRQARQACGQTRASATPTDPLRASSSVPAGSSPRVATMSNKPFGVAGIGRRTGPARIPKAEMIDLCQALYTRGLGCNAIGHLLGFNHDCISNYLRDAGLPRHTP